MSTGDAVGVESELWCVRGHGPSLVFFPRVLLPPSLLSPVAALGPLSQGVCPVLLASHRFSCASYGLHICLTSDASGHMLRACAQSEVEVGGGWLWVGLRPPEKDVEVPTPGVRGSDKITPFKKIHCFYYFISGINKGHKEES